MLFEISTDIGIGHRRSFVLVYKHELNWHTISKLLLELD